MLECVLSWNYASKKRTERKTQPGLSQVMVLARTTWTKLVSNKCIAVRKVATPLRELTCPMRSHSVTCHPAAVTFPPLRSQSWYSIKRPQRDARLSWLSDALHPLDPGSMLFGQEAMLIAQWMLAAASSVGYTCWPLLRSAYSDSSVQPALQATSRLISSAGWPVTRRTFVACWPRASHYRSYIRPPSDRLPETFDVLRPRTGDVSFARKERFSSRFHVILFCKVCSKSLTLCHLNLFV